MIGESVTVSTFTSSGTDAHGDPTGTWTTTTVSDVLVAPGPRSDIEDTERPEGVIVAFNLHFPKSFTGDLRGARVTVRGEAGFKVIGDPSWYTGANTPTRWHMPVEVERGDG
jgi:hypothetical protein